MEDSAATEQPLGVYVERLDVLPAGPELGFVLAGLDVSALSDDEALTVAEAWQRQQAHAEAGQIRALAQFAATRARPDSAASELPGRERLVSCGGEGTPAVEEFAVAEVGAVLGWTTGGARMRMADALDLVHRLPETLAAMASGSLDGFRARILARGTRRLSAQDAKTVQAAVLPRLGDLTFRRAERTVDAEVVSVDPVGAEERRQRARAVRSVDFGPSRDGVRDLFALLDAGAATRLDARVDQVAGWFGEVGQTDDDGHHEPKPARRSRALGLLADPAAVDELWQRVRAARAGDPLPEQTPVPATTLYLHVRSESSQAERWRCESSGALTSEQAAAIVGHSHVTVRPVIDLADVADSAGYQPSDTLAEAVRLLFDTDVFAFSDASARGCDLDHRVRYPIGKTSLANLAPFSRTHHRIKTHGRWTLLRTRRGVHLWTSPTGRRFRVDAGGTRQLPRRPRPRPAPHPLRT